MAPWLSPECCLESIGSVAANFSQTDEAAEQEDYVRMRYTTVESEQLLKMFGQPAHDNFIAITKAAVEMEQAKEQRRRARKAAQHTFRHEHFRRFQDRIQKILRMFGRDVSRWRGIFLNRVRPYPLSHVPLTTILSLYRASFAKNTTSKAAFWFLVQVCMKNDHDYHDHNGNFNETTKIGLQMGKWKNKCV
ncbi:MAG: hypothetical protein Q9174_002209 [Haloplaca sp. 1 TL-2023]